VKTKRDLHWLTSNILVGGCDVEIVRKIRANDWDGALLALSDVANMYDRTSRAIEMVGEYAKDNPDDRAVFRALLAATRIEDPAWGMRAEKEMLIVLVTVPRRLEQHEIDVMFQSAFRANDATIMAALRVQKYIPSQACIEDMGRKAERSPQSGPAQVFASFRPAWDAHYLGCALRTARMGRPVQRTVGL
jgi:hypothetical protein